MAIEMPENSLERKTGEVVHVDVRAATRPEITAVKPEILEVYKQMLSYQLGGTVVLVLLMSLALLTSYAVAKYQPPLLLLVMFAGMLGAFFSALIRLYKIEELSIALISPTISRLGGRYLFMYSFVPPIVGAIGAIVVYIAFAGDLLQGGLFPKIVCKVPGRCGELAEIVNNYGPEEAKDYAKALMWAFIAGFSERLVPDTLQTFARQGTKD
jgi:hypothetical protein